MNVMTQGRAMKLLPPTFATALLSCTALVAASPSVRAQAEPPLVRPSGALDIRLGGFVRFGVDFGRPDSSNLREGSFITDSEVNVTASGVADATGLAYGAVIELEADEFATRNVDETSIFVQGGWGRVVLGSNDSGTLEIGGLSAYEGTVFDGYYGGIGAQTVSAGTGGLDGDISTINPDGFFYSVFDSSDATKIRYDTMVLGAPQSGFVLSAAFTPDSGSRGDISPEDSGDVENVVEAGALYGLGFEGGHVILGATIALGSAEDDGATPGGGDFFDYGIGGELFVGPFGIAGAVGQNESIEADWFSLGVGYRGQVFNASLNYGYSDTDGGPSPQELIASLDTGIMQGVVLQADLGMVDPDTEDDSFVTGLVRIQVGF